jgi:hypothetical protein
MRVFAIVVAMFGMIWATAVLAQDAEAAEIEATINGQMEAFRAKDVDAAFEFASPMIQGMFGNSARFGTMVEQGFPTVWNNETVQYLELSDLGPRWVQRVILRDGTGGFQMYDYMMVRMAEGWRIDGVAEVKAPDVGA